MVSSASEKKVFPTDKDGDNTTRLWTPMKTQLYQSLQQGDRVQQTPEVTLGYQFVFFSVIEICNTKK